MANRLEEWLAITLQRCAAHRWTFLFLLLV